tara:strand:- start:68 stop:724 length:657 start_codon:yes stop_codon:yes gene_type:complete
MTAIIYNQKWQDYVVQCKIDSIIEKICEDSRIQNKGFFSDAIGYFKNSINRFKDWKDNQLMKFVRSTGQKIKDIISKLKNIKAITMKCQFKLYVLIGKFLREDKYVRFAASFLESMLKKLLSLGVGEIFEFFSGESSFTGDLIDKMPDVIKKIIENVIEFIDTESISDLLDFKELAEELFESVEMYNAFRNDISSFVNKIEASDANYSCDVDFDALKV